MSFSWVAEFFSDWTRADWLGLVAILVSVAGLGFAVYAIRDARRETREARAEAREDRSKRDKAITIAKVSIEAAITAMQGAITDMEPLGAMKVRMMQDRLAETQKGKTALEPF